MAASLSGVFNLQVMTSTGAPAFNHRLYTFVNGTTTQKTAWTDAAGTVAHAYVSDGAGGIFIQLNARGELPSPLFLTTGPYDLALKDTLGATVWTRYARGQDDAAAASLATLADSLSAASGDALVAYKRTFTGGVASTLHAWHEAQAIGIKTDLGAVGGGVDEASLLQAALNACPAYGVIDLQGMSLTIGSGLTFPNDNVTFRGPGKITAKAFANFEYMLLGAGRTNCHVYDVEFDANKANRSAGQNIRFMGVGFSGCTDCTIIKTTARNARGFGGISAVGIVMAGGSTRGLIAFCKAMNCGDAGFDADGFFTSGTQNLLALSQATSCTDTGFVIESSDLSGIVGCTADNCAAVGGITNANASDKRGNYINGLTGRNWNGSNTGGIMIGVPGAYVGNLYDTRIDGVVLYADTATYGAGPGIYVRHDGFGKAIGVTINAPSIRGSKNQGIYVKGDDVSIIAPNITGTLEVGIAFTNGTTGGEVNGGKIVGGTIGVATDGTGVATVKNVTLSSQTQYGLYALNTSTITSRGNLIKGSGTAAYGNDAGASIKAATTGRESTTTYSATMATDADLGDVFVITANNGTAFTILAPTNAANDRAITYRIRAGAALGVATWNAVFLMAAWTQPGNGFNRSITFKYNGSNWVETSRTSADVPN